jgi:hypothetical protein
MRIMVAMSVFEKVCSSVARLAMVLGVLIGAGSWQGTAVAQETGDSKLAAEALFEQGRQLMQAGKYPEACEKFAASNATDESVGALLNLGECQTRVGRTASAWGSFRQAAALAQRQRDRKRVAVAEKRAQALEKQLSYLVIEIAAADRIDGLTVARDGSAVPETLWNQRIPVDPGSYAITARAPGHQGWSTQIEIKPRDAGGGEETRVPVPALTAAAEEPGPGAASPEPGSPVETGPVSGPAPDDAPDGMGTSRQIAIGSGALGVAGITAGVVFALRSQSKNDEAFDDGHCDENNLCSPRGVRLVNEARRSATLSYVSYGVGVAAVAAGAVLWFLGAPGDDEPGAAGTEARIRPALGPGIAGIEMFGRF